VAVIAACLVCFAAADRIGKLLGVTGNIVLTRLLGVILAALAVQYVIDGARAAFAS
jgi:multiple antibiotic resistance protein